MTDEAHLSAEQPGPQAASRLPRADGNGRRSGGVARAPVARPEVAQRLITLTKRADFLAANRGRRRVTPGFILLTLARGDTSGAARVGFTVTKKIGGAVVRNRMKRRFRALARQVLAPLASPGHDYVLIGRAGGVERDYGLLQQELGRALS